MTAHYRYPYFNSHSEEKPARQRRVKLFAESAGLLPSRYQDANPYYEHLRHRIPWDHASLWESSIGTDFLLIEPYIELDAKKLAALGYCCITIPINLAPYGGGWSDVKGALPRTTSYLICPLNRQGDLRAIRASLIAATLTVPAWNYYSKGVHQHD